MFHQGGWWTFREIRRDSVTKRRRRIDPRARRDVNVKSDREKEEITSAGENEVAQSIGERRDEKWIIVFLTFHGGPGGFFEFTGGRWIVVGKRVKWKAVKIER